MPSSYSTDLKLELMVTGENAGTWGDITNTNLVVVQQAIAGIESTNVSLSLIDPQEEREKENQSAARHNASKIEGAATYNDPIAQKLWGMGR